jgi:hypothetical protein
MRVRIAAPLHDDAASASVRKLVAGLPRPCLGGLSNAAVVLIRSDKI